MIRIKRNLIAFVLASLTASALAQTGTAPSPFMRMQKPTTTQEVLQTKARRYTPATGDGPVIWLVGVAHVGKADYYKSLQKLLDYQSSVLYEGVTRNGVDPASQTAADPKDDPRQRSTYQTLSDALGLQFQLYGIDYKRPTFHNSDLSWEEMSAIEAKNPAPKNAISLATIGTMLDSNSPQGKQLASSLAMMKNDPGSIEAMHIIMIEALSNPDAISQALSPSLGDLLIKTRNAKVLGDLKTEVAKQPAPRSIAIFFGAGHMADMEKHLTEDFGYVGGEERWYTAIDGDTKKVSGMGQTMLEMMRAAMKSKKLPTGGG